MPHYALIRAWLPLLLALLPGWALAGAALKVGLVPILSTHTLMATYQPLRAHLERELKRPVQLLTAPDFRSFHKDTAAGAFDLVLTPPHLARLAQTEQRMQPLATYRASNRAVLITAKGRALKSIQELRGHKLAVFDPLALAVLDAQHWLAGQGLKAGSDYIRLDTPSHASVAHSVLSGESLMGVTAPIGLRQWTAELRQGLDVYAELATFPALVWLLHPRLDQAREQVQAALLRFEATAEGRRFFEATGYQGLRALHADELRGLDPYALEVARLLREAP